MALPRTVIRLLVPPLAATLLLLAVPGAPGPASEVVGHAQLVSSSPGAGQVLDEAPVELRLIFSEPPDPRHSSLDLLDAQGEPILSGVGSADPQDRYALVAEAPALDDGSFMVVWRALSTADGHTTSGFFTFGVGEAAEGSSGHAMGGGGQHDESLAMGRLHPGHSATDAAIEVVARVMGYLGFMLAFGLALIMVAVLRPVSRQWPRRLLYCQGMLLAAGAAGALVLTVVVSRGPGLDLATYFLETRTGNLLLGRILVGGAGAICVLGLVKLWRPGAAAASGGAFALVGLVLLVLGGHSAAHTAFAPAVAMLVHVGSASVWIAGILLLVIVVAFARRPRTHSLALYVPRFSALALVSVGLLAMSGVYIAWIETRDFTTINSGYSLALAIKVVLAGGALSLGGLNFLEGGRRSIWPVGFRPRILLEGLLVAGVLVATANLASGAPPAAERAVPIAPTADSLASAREVQLEIQPGRPGPNRYWAVIDEAASPDQEVELVLERLDRLGGQTRIALHPSATDPTRYLTDGGLLPRDSTWDASVIVKVADQEVARTRFVFELDETGINEGRRTADIDPALLVAIVLIAGGLLSLAYVLAGGQLPRVERTLGRRAVIAGALIGGVLGVIMLAGGPRL
jgi:copper transport protein